MKIKICGITNVSDALLAERLGADFVGLIFARRSPRCVDPRQARNIISRLNSALPVGVFVEQQCREIENISRQLGLHAVQVYGSLERIPNGVPLIQAIRVRNRESLQVMRSRGPDFFLLDAHNGAGAGGTGKSFDWSLLPEQLDRVFLAGGINSANIHDAKALQPYAVDVCSGVEHQPGVKDPAKLEQLIQEAKT